MGGQICKGICKTHPNRIKHMANRSTLDKNKRICYSETDYSIKKCLQCGQLFKTELVCCPCCGQRMRGKARYNRTRKIRLENFVKRI